MRIIGTVLLVALGCAPVYGATEPMHGVYVADMDRGADPCGPIRGEDAGDRHRIKLHGRELLSPSFLLGPMRCAWHEPAC